MDTLPPYPLMEYQKKSCPFCVANLPHASHITALEMAQADVKIVEVSPGETPSVFVGTHRIERQTDVSAA